MDKASEPSLRGFGISLFDVGQCVVMVTVLFVVKFVVNTLKQKHLKTKLILRPQGTLWCLHLHINEKLLCTLVTTTTLQRLKKQSSYENMRGKKKSRLTLKYLLFITLITLINEPFLCPRGSFCVLLAAIKPI